MDDTITAMADVHEAKAFLTTPNAHHPYLISFTMVLASKNKLLFHGMKIAKSDQHLSTSVYRKPTDTGLLLHFNCHVDCRYRTSLLKTMLDYTYRLPSTKELFEAECQKLKSMFSKLK